jgi:BTB/POZ domain
LLSSFTGEVVVVIVGMPEVRFTVHKALLCKNSKFFEAALTGKFPEAQANEVTLKETDPTVFESFLKTIYPGSREYFLPKLVDYVANPGGVGQYPYFNAYVCSDCCATYSQLLKTYILADFLMADIASDILKILTLPYENVTATSHAAINVPTNDDIQYVYRNSIPSSALRGVVSQQAAFMVALRPERKGRYDAAVLEHPEFAVDIMEHLRKISVGEKTTKRADRFASITRSLKT